MANRVFQSVIYQMKDAINRVVGVVDETGAVISCSELNPRIRISRWGITGNTAIMPRRTPQERRKRSGVKLQG